MTSSLLISNRRTLGYRTSSLFDDIYLGPLINLGPIVVIEKNVNKRWGYKKKEKKDKLLQNV